MHRGGAGRCNACFSLDTRDVSLERSDRRSRSSSSWLRVTCATKTRLMRAAAFTVAVACEPDASSALHCRRLLRILLRQLVRQPIRERVQYEWVLVGGLATSRCNPQSAQRHWTVD